MTMNLNMSVVVEDLCCIQSLSDTDAFRLVASVDHLYRDSKQKRGDREREEGRRKRERERINKAFLSF